MKLSSVMAAFQVDSVAALRNVTKINNKVAYTAGYYAAGDGGHGEYWLDESDTTSPDNGFTVIVAVDGGRWKLKDTLFNPFQAGSSYADIGSATPSANGVAFLAAFVGTLKNKLPAPLTLVSTSTASPDSNGLHLRAKEAEYGTSIVFWKHPTSTASAQRVGQYTGHGNATGSLSDELACYTTDTDGAFVNRYKVLANITTTPFILTGCTGIARSSGLTISLGADVLGGGVSKVYSVGAFGVGVSPSSEFFLVEQNSASTGSAVGQVIRNTGAGDAVTHYQAPSQTISAGIDQSDANKYKVSADNSLGTNDLLSIDPSTKLSKFFGALSFKPATSILPAANGDAVFELTNNNTLTIKVRGSDGVTRSVALTLS